jgi:hypothetical protein
MTDICLVDIFYRPVSFQIHCIAKSENEKTCVLMCFVWKNTCVLHFSYKINTVFDSLGKISIDFDVILGKNEIHKSHFIMNFDRVKTKNVSFRFVFKINLPTKTNDYC